MARAQFLDEYRTVRHAEGWGSADAAYYAALPFHDLTHRHTAIWRIRARSYATFLHHALQPIEQRGTPLTVLDLGAGNGWLAHRLAQRGHTALAFDLLDDPLDGLRALRSYARPARAVLAEFDYLPLPGGRVDVAVFNASFHYSTDYTRTLAETLRVLQTGGTLVILDSPMYADPSSGARMVQEREARFLATYGFASNALDCEHFLTPRRVRELGEQLQLRWRIVNPRQDPRTTLSRAFNGLRARREPASFPVIVGQRG